MFCKKAKIRKTRVEFDVLYNPEKPFKKYHIVALQEHITAYSFQEDEKGKIKVTYMKINYVNNNNKRIN
ncbi:hypothetical protein BpHYR1_018698 [Brachionus plicatilis]|uniref:Uncharacterized protein n=1 Tax=Brachionus plicatilis TaxID=10195 RepID=A0A3M7Q2N4_BRAPC|nr:hypothetical protein BpHYR1_018698 [Brachionus plicatilis]